MTIKNCVPTSPPTKQGHFLSRSRILSIAIIIWAGSVSPGCMASAEAADESMISQLISAGQLEAARTAMEAGNPTDADQLFFAGRVLKAQGRLSEAIQVFREILRLDPDYINARRELAHTLLLNRNYGPAEYHFNALLRIDRNDRMRDGYKRFLTVIHRNRPVGFSGHVSLLPSTNVNRGTDNTAFDTTFGSFVINPEGQADSGVGMQVGISGHLRGFTSAKSRLALNWSLSGIRYEEDRYNSDTGNVALSHEQITRAGIWLLGPYIRGTWRDDNADNDAKGAHFSITHRLNARHQLSLSLYHEYRDYPLQEYQDGTFSSASFGLSRQISPSLSASGGFGYDSSSPDTVHLQYDSRKLTAGLSRSWKGGLQTSFGLDVGERDYAGLFPLTPFPRGDDFHKFNIEVQHFRVDIRGFTPHLYCSHVVNQSNIAFYDYNTTECRVTISRNF